MKKFNRYTLVLLISLLFSFSAHAQLLLEDPLTGRTGLTINEFYNDYDSTTLNNVINQIDSLCQKQKFRSALSIINNVIHNDSSYVPAYGICATINFYMEDYTACIHACNHFLNFEENPEILNLRGIAYYQNQNFREAKRDFDRLVKFDAQYYYLYALWSTFLSANGHCTDASYYYKQALQKNNTPMTWYFVAKSYFLCQQADTALYYIEKVMDSSVSIDEYILMAQVKYELDDYNGFTENMELAMAEMDRMITESNGSSDLYEKKFEVLMSFGFLDRALDLLDIMIKQVPSADLYMNKFYLANSLGLKGIADSALQSAIRIDAANEEALNIMIESFTEKRSYENVISLCNVIINEPAGTYDKEFIAFAYRKRGNAKFLSGKKIEGCEDIGKAASMGDTEAIDISRQTCSQVLEKK